MHEYEQVLRDRTTSGEKPGGPSRVTAMQTRYGQVVKQVGCTREETEQAKT